MKAPLKKASPGLFRPGVWSAIWLSVLLGMSSVAYAQIETKITASDAAAADVFGTSTSLDGDRMIIGAPLDDDACPSDPQCNSGSAYILRFDGTMWIEEAKLTTSDAAAGDQFGHSVSLDGDRAIVGASANDDACPSMPNCQSGSAYVFRRDGTMWTEEAKLTASDQSVQERFGHSVWLDGNQAIIGAYADDDTGGDSGSAYVFQFDGTTWTEEAKITPSDAAAGDNFGYSVSLDGDRALIGAFRDDDTGGDSGSTYVFRFDGTTWIEEAKLTASDAAAGDWFGHSVSLEGDRALIGAFGDADAGVLTGSAYVFHRTGTTWTQEAKLVSGDPNASDHFGVAVSLRGDQALIGAYADAGRRGSAYLFRLEGTSWVEVVELTASDGSAIDRFGGTVSLDGGRALIERYRSPMPVTISA